jgi:hypothetical protein
LIAGVSAEVDARADEGTALSDEQRGERLGEIEIDMLAAERDEEALVEIAHRAGTPIDRRPDASPLALLNVAFKI